MRFEDERYVRLYTRDTTTWLMLPWQSKAILPQILRKLDRAGLLDLGGDGMEALAAHIQFPLEVVEGGMPDLLKRGVLVLRDDGVLLWPKFMEAQEAKQSDRARQKAAREKARDLAKAASMGLNTPSDTSSTDVTARDDSIAADAESGHDVTRRDETVTRRHEPSQPVTLSCAVPSHAVPSQDPPKAPLGGARDSCEMRPLPKSERAQHGELWARSYEAGVRRGGGDPGWSFDFKTLGELEEIITKRCPISSRPDIPEWVEMQAYRFTRAVLPNAGVYSAFAPKGMKRWFNLGCPRESADRSVPKVAGSLPPERRLLHPPPVPTDRRPRPPSDASAAIGSTPEPSGTRSAPQNANAAEREPEVGT